MGKMRYHAVRRRIGEFFRRDYLEGTIIVFGVLMLALCVFATFVTVYAIMHFGDSDPGFKATTSWLKGTSAGAIVFFAIIAAGSGIAGWALAGKRAYRSLRGRRQS